MRNQVVASGAVHDPEVLRFTPAGIPAFEFMLRHQSTQLEAKVARQIQCDMPCVCLGDLARTLAQLAAGTEITVKGFLAARSKRYKHSLVLHITHLKQS